MLVSVFKNTQTPPYQATQTPFLQWNGGVLFHGHRFTYHEFNALNVYVTGRVDTQPVRTNLTELRSDRLVCGVFLISGNQAEKEQDTTPALLVWNIPGTWYFSSTLSAAEASL